MPCEEFSSSVSDDANILAKILRKRVRDLDLDFDIVGNIQFVLDVYYVRISEDEDELDSLISFLNLVYYIDDEKERIGLTILKDGENLFHKDTSCNIHITLFIDQNDEFEKMICELDLEPSSSNEGQEYQTHIIPLKNDFERGYVIDGTYFKNIGGYDENGNNYTRYYFADYELNKISENQPEFIDYQGNRYDYIPSEFEDLNI